MWNQTEESGTNRAGGHLVSVSKYTVLQSFVFIGKLVHDL
jgi:hypothetical protein